MAESPQQSTQYSETIEYERLLLMRINDVDNAIKFGSDGLKELGSLWSKLKKDIRDPIQEDIKKILVEAEDELNKIIKRVYDQESPGMSYSHKREIINVAAHPINIEVAHKIMQIIIDRLDEMGLLIQRQRQVPQGYLPRLKGDK